MSGFTKSLTVDCEYPLPTQVNPPYSHQCQGTEEHSYKTLDSQNGAISHVLADRLVWAINFVLADRSGSQAYLFDLRRLHWIIQYVTHTAVRHLIRLDGKALYKKVLNFNEPQTSRM